MKKSLKYVIFLLILPLLIGFYPQNSISHALSEGGSAKIIVSRCYLYKADNFSSEKVSYVEGENTVLVILEHGEEVEIQSFSGDFAYVVTKDANAGYVYKYYLSDNTSQSVYPVFNGSVRKDTVIYDIDKVATEHTAKKNARVYLYEGFDDEKEYTAVQIVLEDETLYNGYILTADIAPDGVSGLLIIAISVIIAGVTIVLSLVYIRKNKKSKKEKKNKKI